MPPHDAVPELLRAVWERSLPVIRERLDQLDDTAARALSNTLTPDDLDLARSNAHKLAGSLGTFGYAQGSGISRSIEALLETAVDGIRLQSYVSQLRSTLEL
jgi:HPt (histidine-containing phosphotransfer) domain-containing protein